MTTLYLHPAQVAGRIYLAPLIAPVTGTTSVSADLPITYAVRSAVAADLAVAYAVRSSVQKDLTVTYAVRNRVQKDLVIAYVVNGTVVTANLAVIAAGISSSRTVNFGGGTNRVDFL